MQAMTESTHPFAALTPDFVMDALAALGLMGDGRLMTLNSYENRVYLAHLEPGTPLADAQPAVVLKFYRPQRWSRAQIEEEHAFALELAAAEVPVVAPLLIGGRTLHEHGGFLFAGQRDRDVRGERLRQQTQAAGGQPQFDFVAETGIDQQAAHVGVVARQEAEREEAGNQAGGGISVHAGDSSLVSCGWMRPGLISATSLRPTACRPSSQCSVSGSSASGASSGPMLVSPIRASRDRR